MICASYLFTRIQERGDRGDSHLNPIEESHVWGAKYPKCELIALRLTGPPSRHEAGPLVCEADRVLSAIRPRPKSERVEGAMSVRAGWQARSCKFNSPYRMQYVMGAEMKGDRRGAIRHYRMPEEM